MKIRIQLATAIVFILTFINTFATDYKNLITETPAYNQYSKFASYIEQSIENGNASFLNKAFDLDLLMQKIFDRYNPTGKSDFNEGFKKGFMGNFDLGVMITDEISDNGSYKFIRSLNRDGNTYLLFRLLSDRGINYHELEVKQINGETIITDVLLYHTGEKISETIGKIYESFVLSLTTDNNLVDAPNEYLEMQEIKNLWSHGKDKQAFKKWQSIAEKTRNEKAFLILGLQLSAKLSNKQYDEVYNAYVKNFPETSSKYLIPIESLISTKNYSEALQCVDNLDSAVLGDPILNYLRANILFEMGNPDQASVKLNQLIEQMPEYEKSYFSLLNIYILEKNYSDATRLLDKMITNLNYYKGSMEVILVKFPDFCRSKEYQLWMNH